MLAKKKYYSWGGQLVQAGRPENRFFFWPTFVTQLLTPRSRKSGYGLLLGCRSGLDFGPFEKKIFDKVRTQNPGKSALSVLVSVAQYVIRIDTYYVLSIRIIHNTRDGQIWNTQYKGQYNYTFLYL